MRKTTGPLTSIVFIACALSSSAAWAHFRTIKEVERSYELMLQHVILPDSTAGTVIFKECASCDSRSLTVSASTRYFVNGDELPFADFRSAAEDIRAETSPEAPSGVYVYYDIESHSVRRIRLVQFQGP